jgi:hypothetical protein
MCISVRLEKDSAINSATNKNENLSFASKWMELENIIIDVGQVQNIQKLYVLSPMWIIAPKQMQ